MSSASEASIYYIEEATRGTIPTTGNLLELPRRSFSLTGTPQFTEDEQLSAGRIPSDNVKTGDEVAGTVSSSFSQGSFDALLEAAFCKRWDTSGPTFDTLSVGDDDITFTVLEEWGYLQETQKRHVYSGCQVGGFNLSIQDGEIVSVDFDFQGQAATFPTAALTGLTLVPAAPSASLNACLDLDNIKIDDTAINTIVPGITFGLNNNLDALTGVGVCGPQRFTKGIAQASGDINFYHDDESDLLYRNSVNNQSVAFEFTLQGRGTPAKTYRFEMPVVKLNVSGPEAGSGNSQVTIDGSYSAISQSAVIHRLK